MYQSAANAVATATTAPLGQWLAFITSGLAVLGVVYKTGVNTADTKNVKSMVEGELRAVRETLDKLVAFNEDAQRIRLDWAGFRRTTEDTMKEHGAQLGALHLRAQELGKEVGKVMGKTDLLEQRINTHISQGKA